jgi:2-polyprenyl-3-methyl-5-hydroxy-6-metoxy-1,4-benzoquinol methylase
MSIIQLPHLDKRILNWDKRQLAPRKCPICKKKGHPRFVRPDGLCVEHCNHCDTFFVSPSPTDEQLSQFYLGYEKHHRNAKQIDGPQLRKTYLKTDPNSDYRYQVITSLMEMQGKRVLDVGFGRGFFLYFLKQIGAHVTGIELDDYAIQYAREDLEIEDITRTDMLKIDDKEKYDIILFMDLVEHVLEPFQYLNKAKMLLNPGGIIAIFTPNASFALQESAPILFRVDLEHMQYLSNTTCNFLAKKLGLEIIHLENTGYPSLVNITEDRSVKFKVKKVIKGFPGFEHAYYFWNKLFYQDLLRTGRYHLFCVFKKVSMSDTATKINIRANRRYSSASLM